jgi:hypothetical protein
MKIKFIFCRGKEREEENESNESPHQALIRKQNRALLEPAKKHTETTTDINQRCVSRA